MLKISTFLFSMLMLCVAIYLKTSITKISLFDLLKSSVVKSCFCQAISIVFNVSFYTIFLKYLDQFQLI